MKIYHNQKCSKSCAALDLLKQNGFEPEIINYLEEVPSKAELTQILQMLKIEPIELIRTKEPLFEQKFKNLSLSKEEWIEIMIENPSLIERPIVVNQGRAVIGRPIERILSLLIL